LGLLGWINSRFARYVHFNFRPRFQLFDKVDIPTIPRLTNEIVKRGFLRTEPLDESEPLSDVFKEEPAKKMLHIAIQAPLKFNCVVYGDGPEYIFRVTIPRDETVGVLKDMIMEKKKNAFRGLDAGDLKIWKVSISACVSSWY
jgi:hypothetical protein